MEKEKNEDKKGKVICYYHKIDLDGKCSAAIVRRKYPDCELIGVDYPDRPDFDKINEGDAVFVVDFSFEPHDMQALMDYSDGNVCWIDHHKSAIQKIEAQCLPESNIKLTQVIAGKREIGKAGCELTWEYLFPDEPMPEAVRLLGRYDVWDHADEDVLLFQYGMKQLIWNPDFNLWESLLITPSPVLIQKIKQDGSPISLYDLRQTEDYAREMAFPVEFEGHKAWAINKALSNSQIFETLEGSDERPLWILFSFRDGVWKYSLRLASGSVIDVSEIALKYGGGGHADAAGFKSDKYLLKNISLKRR